VFTQIREPDRHFSAFYEDNSLLIQFILEEFIQSYQLTLQMKILIQDDLNSRQELSLLSSSLIQLLGQLVGYLPQQERAPFSRWTKGPLTKFKEYCEQLSHNSSYQNKLYSNLHMAAHQAWLTAIHNLELLNYLHISSYTKKNQRSILFFHPLQRAFHGLQMRFNQIRRYIPRVMSAYWNDENVILCLLRKRALLTEIYGSDFLYKRFKWPMKTSELIRLLVQRYQARGFEALLPTIQHILES
jgi:hypothetical protein